MSFSPKMWVSENHGKTNLAKGSMDLSVSCADLKFIWQITFCLHVFVSFFQKPEHKPCNNQIKSIKLAGAYMPDRYMVPASQIAGYIHVTKFKVMVPFCIFKIQTRFNSIQTQMNNCVHKHQEYHRLGPCLDSKNHVYGRKKESVGEKHSSR